MEILIVILKIFGIFLLILLLAVFALIVVPVHYHMSIKVQEEAEGKIVFHWLFHLMDLRIWYEKKEFSYKLRILGIIISLDREKKTKNKKWKKSKKGRKRKNIEQLQRIGEEEKIEEQQNRSEDKRVEEQQKISEPSFKEDFSSVQKTKKKLKRKKDKKWNFIPEIRKWMENLRNGKTTLKEQIGNIKELILEETNQSALFHMLQEFRYLLRHYSPRKVFGNIRFSIGDPAQTGTILGIISTFSFWSKYKIIIMPDFESESFYVKGTLQIKGRIRSWHVLYAAIRLIKDKNIRKFITSIRK